MRAQFVSMKNSQRVLRTPTHTFQLKHRPFIIQPFMIAPVLPGETLKNLMMQVRAVSDPIKNPLAGWWLEHYLFYVKHRDLSERDEFVDMMLDPNWSNTDVDTAAADVLTYYAGNGVNWTQKCLDRVVETYFRDQGDTPANHVIDGQYIASINVQSWMDSLMLASVVEADDIVVDDNEGTADVKISTIEMALRQYELLRSYNLVTQTYEEYLETFGVRKADAEDPHLPELLRYSREWTYPANTINPSTGAPTSAVSWAISERADKARYFSEPGFVFGVTVARPKVYRRNQIGSAVWFMDNAYTWLPAVMRDDPATSLRKVSGSVVSPLTIANADFYVDVRDLLLYGDQFVNFTMADDTSDNSAPLPTAALETRYYTTDTDIDNFFVDDDTGDAGAHNIKQDGIVTMSIATHERDATPTTQAGRLVTSG